MSTDEEYQQAVAELRRIVSEAPAEWARTRDRDAGKSPREGQWSPKQVVGHLIDSAQVNLQRFLRGQIEPGFAMVYPQDEFVALNAYQERSWADLMTLWVALNRQLLGVVERIPAEKLDNLCGAGDEDWTIRFRVIDYVAHLENHCAQIRKRTEANA